MAYFTKRKDEIAKEKPGISDKDLESYVHNFVAVPDIAGHPTGAAIDATLTTLDGDEVNMGSAIADYSDEDIIKTQADGLTSEQIKNRKLLHDAMVSEGFAPFYGEWWHFSYGDREWAGFYDKKIVTFISRIHTVFTRFVGYQPHQRLVGHPARRCLGSEAVLLTVEERVILLVSYLFDLPCRRHTISPKINSL